MESVPAPEPVEEPEPTPEPTPEPVDEAGVKTKATGKLVVPEFTGEVAHSFNFTINGQTQTVTGGQFFEIMLGVPLEVPEAYAYTWARPQIRGRVRFVAREDLPPEGNVKQTRFVFYADTGGQGSVGVRRKYNLPNPDPAPDFGARFEAGSAAP
jgi:hypothetical protein